MQTMTTIGLDLAKMSFFTYAEDAAGRIVERTEEAAKIEEMQEEAPLPHHMLVAMQALVSTLAALKENELALKAGHHSRHWLLHCYAAGRALSNCGGLKPMRGLLRRASAWFQPSTPPAASQIARHLEDG